MAGCSSRNPFKINKLAEGCLECQLGKKRAAWPVASAIGNNLVYSQDEASKECDLCVPGQFQNTLGQTSCSFCATDTGHFHPTNHGSPLESRTGEPDDSNCLDCPTGKQSNDEHNGCSDCVTGKYKIVDENSKGCQNCQSCDPGKSRWTQKDLKTDLLFFRSYILPHR